MAESPSKTEVVAVSTKVAEATMETDPIPLGEEGDEEDNVKTDV